MIIPELPGYLESIGGGEYKGLIIALFTLTASISRPFSGRLTDTIGRIPVMVIGVGVCVISSMAYPFATTLFGFFALRLLHGLSTGFKPTATAAYVADIIPINKRGEAMGIFGTFGSAGMAFGPAMGSPIAQEFGMDWMFYASAFLGGLSLLVLFKMPETLEDTVRFKASHLQLSLEDVFDRGVWFPGFLLVLTAFSFGLVLTVVPDYSDHLGLANRGVFFTVFTLSSILVRFLAGKASDKYGRLPVLMASTSLMVVSLCLMAFAGTGTALLVAGGVYGLAIGINSPTLYAYTVDLGDPNRKGRALATMYIMLEIGIGLGALLGGWVHGNETDNFPKTFLMPAVLSGLAGFLVIIRYRMVKQ